MTVVMRADGQPVAGMALAAAAPKRTKTRAGGPAAVVSGSSLAKRTAAAILEVLAGVRSPAEAAQALGLAVPKYYHLENRALQGLVTACEPRRLGRVVTPASQLVQLQRAHERLQRDHARQQALLRAAQRALGLPPPPPPAKHPAKRKRRPSARALMAAARLQADGAAADGVPARDVAPETTAEGRSQ
jgi:hypothetical protein